MFDYPKLALNYLEKIEDIDIEESPVKIFSKIGKNYIIFGRNGAGKTKLLKHVESSFNGANTFVMPSNRNTNFGNLGWINLNFRNHVNLQNIFNVGDNAFPNDYLFQLLTDRNIYEITINKTIYNRRFNQRYGLTLNNVVNIFNEISVNRKLFYSVDNSNNGSYLMLKAKGIEPYKIDEASDGEKCLVQFIIYILLCPENSFIFIDEPESHFNSALLVNLFNRLEKERSDIVFIYCTHNVDFIETRNNCDIVYLNSYDGNKWDSELLSDFDKLPIKNIIDVIGTKQNVIFVESMEKKLDFDLYNIIFDDYKIIPVESCEKVVQYCKLFNSTRNDKIINFLKMNRKVYGIIDNDFKNIEAINKYKKSHIFTLPFSEIENLLLSSTILEFVLNENGYSSQISKIKNEIILIAKSDKNNIISDYINKKNSLLQKCNKLMYNGKFNDLKKSISDNFKNNLTNFKGELIKFERELNLNITKSKYDEIIKKYPDKGFKGAIERIGISWEEYTNLVFESIKNNNDFKKIIRDVLFSNFFN